MTIQLPVFKTKTKNKNTPEEEKLKICLGTTEQTRDKPGNSLSPYWFLHYWNVLVLSFTYCTHLYIEDNRTRPKQ